MPEKELEELRAIARERGTTVSEVVRGAIRSLRDERLGGDPVKRLAAIRAATRNAFPTGDIDQMLAEIEQGYTES